MVSFALAGLLGVAASGCLGASRRTPVRLNQHGYLPALPKIAVVVAGAEAPQPWALRDRHGERLLTGSTTVWGRDVESGQRLHWADFSALTAPGEGYSLEVGRRRSHPFRVGADVYRRLKYDALAYFYHNRSGTPIEQPYVSAKKYTRPAGHVSDAEVRCIGTSCAYTLDVSGGWYDAGDHGKYVVNGGIAVWTLLSLWERTQALGAGLADFGDGTLAIPERANGVPDLLDEARWELEFLLRMQIPRGQEQAGMVHHKVHDSAWSSIGTVPPATAQYRFLHPPSTAATLNLAATAAQCARIYAAHLPELARRCRGAAVRAWNAAQRHPAVFAPPTDTQGGGAYDDAHVDDEFYWAAAELYATLRRPELLAFLRRSAHHGRFAARVGHGERQHTSMTWQDTAALGAITLAVVPSDLPAEEVARQRGAIVAAADAFLALSAGQGYRLPFAASDQGHYPWGSSSFVVNNALVLALAHDFTGQRRYLDGVVQGMDYLLGRNPLDFSYVAGYGRRFLENPHHRFWAHGIAPLRPAPPPGALAGGPNSRLQDPTVRELLAGCAPMRCYVDEAMAWSVNEVAINWNAPLAWVAAYLDEQGRQRGQRAGVAAAPAEQP